MKNEHLARKLMLMAARTMISSSVLLLLVLAMISAAVLAQSKRQEARFRVDALLVMGAAQYNGTPSPVLQGRLDTAFDLYRRGLSRRIIVTGGALPGDPYTEAGVSRDYLISKGVSPDVILVEDQGRDSLSSLRAAGTLAHQHDVDSVIVVTDSYHQLRALKMARDQGLTAYGEPARNTRPESELGRFSNVVREAWGYLAYVALGK